MNEEQAVCPHCGTRIIKYEHRFNELLRSCIWKLANNGSNQVSVRDLGLTTSEWTNFAKLRYWGLAEKVVSEDKDATHKGGVWQMTELGARFVNGESEIHVSAVVCQNHVMELKGGWINIHGEVTPAQHVGDFREQAREQIGVAPGQMMIPCL